MTADQIDQIDQPAGSGPSAEFPLIPFAHLFGGQVDQARWLYEEAFPAGERVPFADLVEPDAGDVAWALVDGGDVLGMVSLCGLGEEYDGHWLFLRYFAVTAARRGQGLGGRLWRAMFRKLGTKSEPPNLLLEVEDPAEADVDRDEQLLRARRIAFYRRLGATLLPVADYRMPDLENEHGGGLPMLLMGAGAAGAPTPDEDELTRLVLALYLVHYGLSESDELVNKVVLSNGSG
ncbi:GNAT family N-acetyltransferase [Solihabitans fulvus]|uniref:GNAT family N-acetyltransferase n=1 Tax=Solihabitans fulvus TaxID=1892852 RepID=A0A5B2XMW5_9PSEU|nr:GNAT family N-acetyltransferase [Solihabitans fulvus]KAA2264304.1 GNAT family N-acetyltransferase [Solihabitans fulvus]